MTQYTEEEWHKKGHRLFGKDVLKWEFKCPMCHKVQTPEDFRKFKDIGASPDDAHQRCMGRFTGGKSGPDGCDWAAYGLFRGPAKITKNNGAEIWLFDFAETKNEDKKIEEYVNVND